MASKPHNLQSSSKRSDMLYNLYWFILKYKNKQYTSSEIFTKLIEKKSNTTSFSRLFI
jgi:hypothetical protein